METVGEKIGPPRRRGGWLTPSTEAHPNAWAQRLRGRGVRTTKNLEGPPSFHVAF